MATKAQKFKRIESPSGIENLPAEVIHHILSRLPISFLFQSRYVSKPWRNLINDPALPTLHYTNTSQNPNAATTSLIMFPIDGEEDPFGKPVYFLYYIPNLDTCDKKAIRLTNFPIKSWCNLVGSCNGFICLSSGSGSDSDSGLFVCNPVIGDWVRLPDPPPAQGIFATFPGFGYDSTNNEYKVIRLEGHYNREEENHNSRYRLQVNILTVGCNSWRSIANIPWSIIYSDSGVLFDGYLHWLTPGSIRAFDVENEKFQGVPVPNSIDVSYGLHLTVLEGHLTLVDESMGDLHVWMMKNYGVKESWTLEFVFQTRSIQRQLEHHQYSTFKILGVQTNGDVVVQCGDEALLIYNPQNKSYNHLHVHGLPPRFHAFSHIGTLVSLKDVITNEAI